MQPILRADQGTTMSGGAVDGHAVYGQCGAPIDRAR